MLIHPSLYKLLAQAYVVIHHVCPVQTLCHLAFPHELWSITHLDQQDQTQSFKFLSQTQTNQASFCLIFPLIWMETEYYLQQFS